MEHPTERVRGGQTVFCGGHVRGMHGAVRVTGIIGAPGGAPVTIAPLPGHTPVLSTLTFVTAARWLVRDIVVAPRFADPISWSASGTAKAAAIVDVESGESGESAIVDVESGEADARGGGGAAGAADEAVDRGGAAAANTGHHHFQPGPGGLLGHHFAASDSDVWPDQRLVDARAMDSRPARRGHPHLWAQHHGGHVPLAQRGRGVHQLPRAQGHRDQHNH